MSFMNTFKGIKDQINLKPKEYNIDNLSFKLHYRASVAIFLLATVLVTSRQYIGEHIKCIAEKSSVPENVINTYCFFTSTFTVLKYYNEDMVDNRHVPHPGVGPYSSNSTEPIRHHAYYQWVPFVLFGQALMFYLTHLIWKKIEGGRIKTLVEGLRLAAFALTDKSMNAAGKKIPSIKDKQEAIKLVRKSFFDRIFINKSWASGYIFCEVLNILHVVFQFYITDLFLTGQFYGLGSEVIEKGVEDDAGILEIVFPKITKCTFHKYGPSGSLQYHDAMCIMALNIINEKIYVFVWFWFIFLFSVSVLNICWRCLTIYLHSRSRGFNNLVFSSFGHRYKGSEDKENPFKTVPRHFQYSDWLLLKYISKNLDPTVVREIFEDFNTEIEDRKLLLNYQDDFES